MEVSASVEELATRMKDGDRAKEWLVPDTRGAIGWGLGGPIWKIHCKRK